VGYSVLHTVGYSRPAHRVIPVLHTVDDSPVLHTVDDSPVLLTVVRKLHNGAHTVSSLHTPGPWPPVCHKPHHSWFSGRTNSRENINLRTGECSEPRGIQQGTDPSSHPGI